MNRYELEKVQASQNNAFTCYKHRGKLFTRSLHLHPEIELLYVEEGRGNCIVANSFVPYKEGDLFFFHANLPHCFKSDENYHSLNNHAESRSICIQFTQGILPADYMIMPGCKHIRSLLKAGEQGIKWDDMRENPLITDLQQMDTTDGFERLHKLYELLNTMGCMTERGTRIASDSYVLPKSSSDTNYYQIIRYINLHFRRTITLEEIASAVNMNISAMCRYFKAKAGQTIFDYLLNVRIAIVKEILATTDKPISLAAYECGFNSIPNFNIYFKRTTGLSPTEFRKKMR